jgi:phosphoglycolate phosphatase
MEDRALLVTLPIDGKPLRALVFDLDGTLIDSAGDLRAALNQGLTARGRPPLDTDRVRRMTGDGIGKLVERALAATGEVPDEPTLRAVVDDVLAAYTACPVAETVPYPDVVDSLRAFHTAGLRMAVCTNKVVDLSRLILETLGLAPFFDIIIGGDSLAQRKPDPEPVLACLSGLKAGPEEALFVGDSRNDLLAARAAGLPMALIPSGYGTSRAGDPSPDLKVCDMATLARLILR